MLSCRVQICFVTTQLTNPPDPLPFRVEFERKAVHVLMVFVPLAMLHVAPRIATVTLGALAMLGLAADLFRARQPGFERLVQRWFGRLMRDDERAQTGIRINGATWLFLGGFLAALLFGVRPAAFALATFIVGDAAAGLVGRYFGRPRLAGSKATLPGSTAFFVTAAAVGLLLQEPSVATCLLAAAVSTVAEATAPVDDNLVVPIVAAAAFFVF